MRERDTQYGKQNNMERRGRNKKRRVKSKIKITLQLFTILVLSTITAGIFYFYYNYGSTIFALQRDAKEKVAASNLDTFRASQTSIVYDADGKVISTIKSTKDVYYLEYENIPEAFIDAMIVSEDRKFLKHGGVDYIANIRAAVALIKNKGRITQGASTITQQLARNIFLSNKKTYERKIEEIYIAEALEKKYTKMQIMEFYLNNIYFANGHYGIQAASKSYFGKTADKLSLSQVAFLCSIPNNPNMYNPVTNMDNTLSRRDRILKQLYDEGKINQEDYNNALTEKIKLKKQKTEKNNYINTYITYCAVRALMKEKGFQFRYEFEDDKDKKAYDTSYDEMYESCQKNMYTAGYRIYTSIDRKKQKILQNSVDEALKNFTEVGKDKIYELQGAAVCIDNSNGKVVSIVGGRSQDIGGYYLNRAYQSFRQPGSSIKPLAVYTPAFENGYTPNTIVDDRPIKDGPKNYGGKYSGKMKLSRAIELSTNTVAWTVFKELTPKVGLSYLHHMNFSKIQDSDNNLATALGGLTIGVSPVEMASGYATIENNGYYREPTCIIKILDSDGNQIVKETSNETPVYKEESAKMMTEVLMGVIKNGTGHGLGLSYTESAGKTGTTNDKKDGWFCGYTPYYTTSVWVGCDIPKAIPDLTGGSYPGTIWHNFMNQIHDSSMRDTFELTDWRSKYNKDEEKKKVTPVPTQAEQNPSVKDTQDNKDTQDENSQDTNQNPQDNNTDNNGGTQDFEDPATANQGTEDNTQTKTDSDNTGKTNTGKTQNKGGDTDSNTTKDQNSGNSDNGAAGAAKPTVSASQGQ